MVNWTINGLLSKFALVVKKRALVIFMVCILFATVLLLIFLPCPVVRHVDTAQIHYIFYYPNAESTPVFVKQETNNKLIAYLAICDERRTLNKAGSISLADVVLKMSMTVDGNHKEIVLGKANYSSNGYGTLKNEILNGEEVLKNTLLLLNLSDVGQGVGSSVPQTVVQQ